MTTIYIQADELGNILEWGTSLLVNGVAPPSVEIEDVHNFAWYNYLFLNGQLIPKEGV